MAIMAQGKRTASTGEFDDAPIPLGILFLECFKAGALPFCNPSGPANEHWPLLIGLEGNLMLTAPPSIPTDTLVRYTYTRPAAPAGKPCSKVEPALEYPRGEHHLPRPSSGAVVVDTAVLHAYR
ncbi:hypothetical protein EMPG_12432 [Blastomyces silverae]|uniref:Uncharacterized protein n=1 Tax=Blastomyces silverae TaxID=2060906 RepID=A0A0H1BMH9_9EURO|nr:hypothetical protein EMPG_12432 [Blastomyces silverae]